MEFSISNISLLATTVLVGLSAGLCFTWGNAVTPGIGQLDTLGYLEAFQKMNRAILNPPFFLVFLGALPVGIAAVLAARGESPLHFRLVLAAVILYGIGVVLVTVFGNVPLNQILDKTDLAGSTLEELATLRKKFETPWNRFHSIRVVSSILSFALLALAGLMK